jgi:CheY-like chemotaxis protein
LVTFISGLSASIRFRSFLHQALVMKATRTAPVDKLVVVIDDDPLILEATGGLLQSWGCCVVTAQSCEEALVRLAETEAGRRPDVIVSDYQLSRGLTGIDAIERLRSAFPNPIPALLISGDASSPRCEVGSQGLPPFVQAGECGEASRGAGRRLRAATVASSSRLSSNARQLVAHPAIGTTTITMSWPTALSSAAS